MAYFTKTQLAQTAQAILARSQLSLNETNARMRLNADRTYNQMAPIPAEPAAEPVVVMDIFLAHSSLDKGEVLGLYHLLRDRGYKVYLDQVCDPQLDPATVTRATARVLRYRLAQCKSLFIATTINTPSANWVPWELGFSDGWNGKAAIMPILDSPAASFQGREYFELYPEVRDAGTSYPYPRDLDIYEQGSYQANWTDWVVRSRTF